MEDISTEAGVGKGTLYRYFKDKDELYLALLERAAEQIHPLIEERLRGEIDPVQKLISVIDGLIDFFDEQSHLFELIQQAESRYGTHNPWQPARLWLIELVKRIFCEAEQQKVFEVHDLETTALMLLGGMKAVIAYGSKPRPERLAEQLVLTVLDGAAICDRKRHPVRVGE
jgi:AcrR family transcriptional regulator